MSQVRSRRNNSPALRRCFFEPLEDRTLLAVFNVNTTNDSIAVNPINGVDVNGKISLRSAIQAANFNGGSHTINLPSGTYNLTIIGFGEDQAAEGDLDIKADITIDGSTRTNTIINGQLADRIFHVFAGNDVVIQDLTITNGFAANGAGVFNAGQLELNDVNIEGNQALGANGLNATVAGNNGGNGTHARGGGIYNSPSGDLTLIDVVVSNNLARGGQGGNGAAGSNGNTNQPNGGAGGNGGRGGNGYGGALYNARGLVTLSSSTVFTENEARGGNAGAGGAGGFGAPQTTVATGNGGTGGSGGVGGAALGGAIYHSGAGQLLSVAASSLTLNTARGGNGGSGAVGGAGAAGTTLLDPTSGGAGGLGGKGGNATGGGLHNAAGDFAFTSNSRIEQNVATSGSGGQGGQGGAPGQIALNATETALHGARGGNGGNGAVGGQAFGGGIHTTGGEGSLSTGSIVSQNTVLAGASGAGGNGAAGSNAGIIVEPGDDPVGQGGDGGNGGNAAGGALAAGGGISLINGTLSISGSTLSDNLVTGGVGGNGGSGGSGGNGSPAGIGGSSKNGAVGGKAMGGGIAARGGTLNLQLSTMLSNQVIGGKGGNGSVGSTAGANLVTDAGGHGNAGGLGGNGGEASGAGIVVTRGTANIQTSSVRSGSATGGLGGLGGRGGHGTPDLGVEPGGNGGHGGRGGHGGNGLGGGFAAVGGVANVTRSTFASNAASAGAGNDGGQGGDSGNGNPDGDNGNGGGGGKGGSGRGAGFYAGASGTLNLSNSTFDSNLAAGDNGGLGGDPGTGIADGGTPGTDGTAGPGQGGGGFHTGSGIATLINNTFTRNNIDTSRGSNAGSGGGLFNSSGTLSLQNNLLALNTLDAPIAGGGIQVKGTFNSLGNNLVSNVDGGAGFVASDLLGNSGAVLDARVGTLANNGGPTHTVALLIGSPAIGAGNATGAPTIDQRGNNRGAVVDIGAYEF